VRVRQENCVNRRKILNAEAGMALAAQEDEVFRKYRVDEDVLSPDLEKEGGVTDEGDADFFGGDEARLLVPSDDGLAMRFSDDVPELAEFADDGRVWTRHG